MGCAAVKAPRVCAAASPADGSRLTRPGLQLVPGESLSVVCSHAAQLRAHFPLAVTVRAAAEFDANRCTHYVTDSAGEGCTGAVDISKLRTGSKCRFQVVSPDWINRCLRYPLPSSPPSRSRACARDRTPSRPRHIFEDSLSRGTGPKRAGQARMLLNPSIDIRRLLCRRARLLSWCNGMDDERHVFSTVIACLSGFRGADRTRIWEQIVRGGGAVTTDRTSNCTHLVTSELRGDKCRKAMDMDINIVPAMWVTRSLQNRRKEDEDSYCARKPLEALVQVATDPLLYHGQEVRAPLCVP